MRVCIFRHTQPIKDSLQRRQPDFFLREVRFEAKQIVDSELV